MIGTSSKTAACGKCVYWYTEDSAKGECRRHAPQTIVHNGNEEVRIESMFPVTRSKDWCGDFEPQ